MITLQIIWSFIKKYWKYLLAAAVLIAALIAAAVLRDNKLLSESIERFRAMLKIADDEAAQVRSAAATHSASINSANQQLSGSVAQINQQYIVDKGKLDASVVQTTESVLTGSGGDAKKLAEELGAVTGINVIMPKD